MHHIRRIVRQATAFAVLSLTLAGSALAAEVQAKKDGVEIYADATNKSDVLGKLGKDQSLPAGERKGMFWQVKTKDGKDGYVSVLAVTRKADGNSDLSKAIKSVVNKGHEGEDPNESRARSAVMGVRGLRADDDMANASNVRPNLRAVYKMEETHLSDKKLKKLGDEVFDEIARKSEAGGE